MDEGWELCILVEDLGITRQVRVRGDTHIGGVMLKLIEAIEVPMDWSDHALWWPDENRWLLKTRRTLDQIGLMSDSKLEFHRMHNITKVQLPDLQELELRINYAQSVFGVVVGICRELGIRHPEELSLRRPLDRLSNSPAGSTGTLGGRFGSFRRSNRNSSQPKPEAENGGGFHKLTTRQLSSTSNPSSSPRTPSSLGPSAASPISLSSLRFQEHELARLANSPSVPLRTALLEKGLLRCKSLADRAAMNEAWFNSARSLMEQGLRPDSGPIQLRYKFHDFYDLNPKYDSVRINQIYEQTKWSLLTEELESTEEEALLLAALQLQISLQAGSPSSPTAESPLSKASVLMDEVDSRTAVKAPTETGGAVNDDDIDAALDELEASLMSGSGLGAVSPTRLTSSQNQQQQQRKSASSTHQKSIEEIPELSGYLKYFKPKKNTLRSFRRKYFVLRNTTLEMYSDQSRSHLEETFNLLSAEVSSDVSATAQKFGFRLFVPSLINPDDCADPGMKELWLRCDGRDQYSQWLAGITLATGGKTLASKAAFEAEAAANLAQMELQSPRPQRQLKMNGHSASLDFEPENFLAGRHLKSRKQSWLRDQILLRHANLRDRGLVDAKLDYIRICQRISSYGIAYFLVHCTVGRQPEKPTVVSFSDNPRSAKLGKLELIGVASNRLMRLDASTGKIVGSWRLEEICNWTINWEQHYVQLLLGRSPHALLLAPRVQSEVRPRAQLDLCKALVELLGGVVFLSLRQSDKSQQLNEQEFHKLTCGLDEAASR